MSGWRGVPHGVGSWLSGKTGRGRLWFSSVLELPSGNVACSHRHRSEEAAIACGYKRLAKWENDAR